LTSSRTGDIGVTFGASRTGKLCLPFNNCNIIPALKLYPSLMAEQTKLIELGPPCVFNFCIPLSIFHSPFSVSGPVFKGRVPATDMIITKEDGTRVNLYGNYFGATTFQTVFGSSIYLSGEFYPSSEWHTGIFLLGNPL
jgi:hypothetical protein